MGWAICASLNLSEKSETKEMMKETEFLQTFANYRYGIEKVLPAYLNGSFTDTEALVDEMALILDSRDTLGAALAGAFGLRQSHLQAIDRLDE